MQFCVCSVSFMSLFSILVKTSTNILGFCILIWKELVLFCITFERNYVWVDSRSFLFLQNELDVIRFVSRDIYVFFWDRIQYFPVFHPIS